MKEEIALSRAHRLINHGAVLLVTSKYRRKHNIITLAWQTPVSSKPCLVALSIAPTRYSHNLINDSAEFVINIPTRGIVREVHYCGTVSGREKDKFEETGLTPIAAGKVKPPLVKECIGHLECKLVETHPIGDHTLFVGEVLLALVEKNLFDEYWIVDNELAKTVHHLGGAMYTSPARRAAVDCYSEAEW